MTTVVASITGSLATSLVPLKYNHVGTTTVWGTVTHGGGTTISAGSGVTYLLHSKIPLNHQIVNIKCRAGGPNQGTYAVVLMHDTEVTLATACIGAAITGFPFLSIDHATTLSNTAGFVYLGVRAKPGSATTSVIATMMVQYQPL